MLLRVAWTRHRDRHRGNQNDVAEDSEGGDPSVIP